MSVDAATTPEQVADVLSAGLAVADAEAPAPAARDPRRVLRKVAMRTLDGRGWTAVRLTLDVTALLAAVLVTLSWPGHPMHGSPVRPLLLFPPLVVGALFVRGMYGERLQASVLDLIWPVLSSVSIAAMGVAMVEVYVVGGTLESGVIPHVWALSLALVGAGRAAAIVVRRMARRRHLVGRPTLIVGAGAIGSKIARRLRNDPSYGLNPVGFLDECPPSPGAAPGQVPLLGTPAELESVARSTRASQIVLAFASARDRSLLPLVRRASAAGLQVSLVPRMFETVNSRLTYDCVAGVPVLSLHGTDPRGRMFGAKHALDRVAALALLALLAPLMLVVAAAVLWSSRGPILFRQWRVGRDGRVFELLKFRTMYGAPKEEFRPASGLAPGGVEGIDRRTRIGCFLRRTSLDELPQLLNVLRGEMSLVGPRPERPFFAERFRHDIERYGDRLRVKAGITGWAQVNGLRGQTSVEDRAEWDNYYIENWSLWFDLKILALTVLAVFRSCE